MFTGLVECTGEAAALERSATGARLDVRAPKIGAEVEPGDSIAVNGCCLTVAAIDRDILSFDLLGETLSRTNLGELARDEPVNLERALAATGRLGGHFVQGHIDVSAEVHAFEAMGRDARLEVALPAEFARFVVSKGSIAVDGISLTVAEVRRESFVVWIIPHTRATTNLQGRQAGDRVNLEFDLLAKYVERLLAARAS